MTSRVSLQHLYKHVLCTPPDQLDNLSRFFQQTLSIPGASWEFLTGELEALKHDGSEDIDCIAGLYQYLNKMGMTGDELR